MQDSVSQYDFYGNCGMHYIFAMPKEAEDEYMQGHDFHLGCQE
jgi:hypothetical protein